MTRGNIFVSISKRMASGGSLMAGRMSVSNKISGLSNEHFPTT